MRFCTLDGDCADFYRWIVFVDGIEIVVECGGRGEWIGYVRNNEDRSVPGKEELVVKAIDIAKSRGFGATEPV